MKTLIPLFALGAVLVFSSTVNVGYVKKSTNRHVLSPSPAMRNLLFGFNQVVADSFWINVIQDFDFCEQIGPKGLTVAERGAARSKLAKEHLESGQMTMAEFNKFFRDQYGCNKGWTFRMLDFITDIDPLYNIAFSAGALMLSVSLDDASGAAALFQKGFNISKDWAFFYRGVYHFIEEEPNPKEALRFAIRAHELGGPSWLPALVAKTALEAGSPELAIPLLRSFIDSTPESIGRQRLVERLDELTRTAKREGRSGN